MKKIEKNILALDCEVYPNYTLFAFKNLKTDVVFTIEIKGKDSVLENKESKILFQIMNTYKTFGYNSNNYDIPIILHALNFKTSFEIYKLSSWIIENNSPEWKTCKSFGLYKPKTFDHIDIQQPAPAVKISLKLYGARMHSKRLQDLPIEPGTYLSEREMADIKTYCINDLDTTIDLFNNIKPRIKLRENMTNTFNVLCESSSDAQIAEKLFKSELKKKLPYAIYKAKKESNTIYKYSCPNFINFNNPILCDALHKIEKQEFKLNDSGHMVLPTEIKKLKIKIGSLTYQLGIGGIHSTEKKTIIKPKEDELLIDRDVVSYYPSIILNLKLYPKNIGPIFLEIYKRFVDERIEAKKIGNDVLNESLKILINGTFGKLGSKYSIFYAPELLMKVTLTGQLSLLMLIEKLEANGITVVSANTDGFISFFNKNEYDKYKSICSDWESATRFQLEETPYRALYARDVNNYLALKEGSEYKAKGIFAINSLMKNPHANICIKAVIDFLKDGKSIEETILKNKDLTEFLFVRSVTGGAVFNNQYLGKVVRWIYSTEGGTIRYKKNNNKVAESDGSLPIMELGEGLPESIDYDRYINVARSILDDLGYGLSN